MGLREALKDRNVVQSACRVSVHTYLDVVLTTTQNDGSYWCLLSAVAACMMCRATFFLPVFDTIGYYILSRLYGYGHLEGIPATH